MKRSKSEGDIERQLEARMKQKRGSKTSGSKEKKKRKMKRKENEIKKRIKKLIIIGIIGMTFLNFGFNLGALSPFTTQTKQCGKEEEIIKLKGNTFKTCINIPYESIWTMSIAGISIGGAIGAITAPILATCIGKKGTLIMSNLMGYIIGYIMMMMGSHYITLIVSRVIIGIATGMISTITPMILNHQMNSKSASGTILQINVMGGYFIASLISIGLWNKPHGLRWMYMPMIIITLLQTGCLAILIPEGVKKREEQKEEQKELGYLIKMIFFGIIIMVGRQFCGMNAFIFYSYPILKQVGVDHPIYGYCIFAGLSFVLSILAYFIIGWISKKQALIIGEIGMIINLCLLSLCQFIFPYINKEHSSTIRGSISLCLLVSFVGCFQMSLGSIPFFILSERSPSRWRSLIVSISTLTNWISSFLASMITPLFQKHLGRNAFIPWIITSSLTIGLTIAFYPKKLGKHSKSFYYNNTKGNKTS
mmetsp:Transcript_6975/g.10213  ORF Transcript_6975/g.10213 Transcript_6975/m.10213 type:complete len:478 (-) Transcript_6975:335-1768(-)